METHLPFASLVALVALCYEALSKGGIPQRVTQADINAALLALDPVGRGDTIVITD